MDLSFWTPPSCYQYGDCNFFIILLSNLFFLDEGFDFVLSDAYWLSGSNRLLDFARSKGALMDKLKDDVLT